MTQNPTFGCGVFLPGEGPGNFPEFTGGGTIDCGSGDGGDDPDPPIPVDPADPISPSDPPIGDPGPLTPPAIPPVPVPPGGPGPVLIAPPPIQVPPGPPGPPGPILAGPPPLQVPPSPPSPPGIAPPPIQVPPDPPGPGPILAGPPPLQVPPSPPGPGGGISPGGPAGAAPPPVQPPGQEGDPGDEIRPGGSAGAPPPVAPVGSEGGGVSPGPDSGSRPGVSIGGDLPTTPPPVIIPGDALPNPAGEGLISESNLDINLLNNSLATENINLNDPSIITEILKLKPNGIEDSTIAFNKNPENPTLVFNDTEFTELFNERIDSNTYYILKNKNNGKNWDSTKSAGVTATTILANLKPEIRSIIDKIRNYDGTKLTQNQIFSMIGSRILDGSIGEITKQFLQRLADDSQKRVPTTITRSSIDKVNEIAALILIDKNKIPLDTSKLIGREQHIFKNFKILSSDVDKFLPVTINGVNRRFYINDDDTFIDRVTLSISDGDFFDVVIGGKTTRLFAESELDHAFIIPEDIKQRVITLLGGESGRTLSVSGDAETASGIEYDSSLSSSRQPFYVLSAVLSSLQTSPSLGGSFLLKDTTIRYQLMDTSTTAGLSSTNEFIKFKANKRIFVLDHEDLIIDYIENTESVNLTQTDILFNSPKINKTIPLLVRQIPFYIMVYPTNRSDYNIFNDKSRIIEISNDGAVSRELRCKTHINPEFTQSQTNKFIRYKTVGRDATDILGRPDPQTRISFIDSTDKIFKTGFKKDDRFVSASEYDIDRSKTGFRLLREIINELDTNYELSINGVGKTLTEFDTFSRLNLKQFNILSRLENFNEINKAISNGLINKVKLIPPIENADNRIVINKTQLVQRKRAAGDDTFKPIKATNDGRSIISPNKNGVGGFGPVS